MKMRWLFAGLFMILEQSIKIFIWNLAMDIRITFIPGVLRFEPYQNINLNWLASMDNIVMPAFLMGKMSDINPNCKCPSLKCPNRGKCKDCVLNHHKGLHTYCKAGKLEGIIRDIYARLMQ